MLNFGISVYFSQLCHDKLPKNDSAQYIYIYIFMPFIFNKVIYTMFLLQII